MCLLLFFALFVQVLSGPVLNIPKCGISDESCVTNAVKEAYSLIFEADSKNGADNIEPLFVPLIDGNLSILKYKLYNSTVTGFKTCKLESAKFGDSTQSLVVALDCKKLVLKGWYDINGQLVILPVQGTGNYIIDADRFKLTVTMELKNSERDGKVYMHVKNFKVDPVAVEPIVFLFNNLFNGQKDLSDAVHKFANENWKEVAGEVQGPVFTEIVKKIIKNANKYLKAVPIEN